MRHRANCWWYIRIQKCWFFLHGNTILNGGHYTETTVSTVIARNPPNHGHSKRHTTSFSIHPSIEFGWTRSVAHVWCPFLSWFPTLQPKYKKYAFLWLEYWNNFLRQMPFSANIADLFRVIYALPGHFCKYTTQSMTAECQLKLSRHTQFSWKNLGTPSTIRPLS